MALEPFTGFPHEGLSFLSDLGTQNKVWFDERRETYLREVVGPAKSFVVELGERLEASFAPHIVAIPRANGSISPINNDLRFNPTKSPYKDKLLFKLWEGADKLTAPMLMVLVGEHTVGFSVGANLADVGLWRERVAAESSGAPLFEALEVLAGLHPIDVSSDQLQRVPKPFPSDHPREDLLRRKGLLHIRWSEPTPPQVNTAEFVDFCMDRLTDCADLHHWFVEHP